MQTLLNVYLKVMKISPQSTFHLQDLEPLLEFGGRIESLIKRFHAGNMMASCVPLVHTLNRTNWIDGKIMVHIFYVIYPFVIYTFIQYYNCFISLATGIAAFSCS